MRIRLLGGLQVTTDDQAVSVTGAMQLAVLFRLAVDAGASVGYRAMSEDVWGQDAPENTRASLQSIVSRLRSQLPPGVIESTAGGYRLAISRKDVDALVFEDLVAAASAAVAPAEAAQLASEALALWGGDPWIPSENFDWFERDLRRDRQTALDLGGAMAPAAENRSIPVPLTSLVGRSTELAMVGEQLASNRLVTIIGTGGAGKTRLAIEAASRQRAAILVELAPVTSQEVTSAVLAATGREIRMADGTAEVQSTRARLYEALSGREVVLVLDNCEHVIDMTARLASNLLGDLPQLRILATSREPLGIPGEAFVGVGSLSHPTDSEVDRMAASDITAFAAVELFCQRAHAARGRVIDKDELPVAAHICARLDGLPLAIELAAAKLRTMTVEEVLTGLEDRFSLLTGGFRSALPRHQTLRAMIDWSWSLLSDDERRALAWFAVFPAGVSAAEAPELASEAGFATSAVFDALVDKSLLQRARGRYRALETIREYGFDRLAESGEQVEARHVQARFMSARARKFDRMLRGPRIMDAIDWFDDEEDNIYSALRFATGMPLPEIAVTLAVSCIWYWLVRDRSESAYNWMTAVAPLAASVESDEARIMSLVYPFMQAWSTAQPEELVPESIEPQLAGLVRSFEQFSLGSGTHELLQLIGPILTAFADVAGSPEWMLRVRIPDGAELGLDPWPAAVLEVARAAMSQNRGEIDTLGVASGKAVDSFTAIGDLWGLALSQQMRAEWLLLQGDLHAALAMTDDSTENMRRITSAWDLAQQQGLAVSILARLGRIDEARERVDSGITAAEADGNVRAIVQAQITAVSLDVVLGDVASGGNHLAALDRLFESWPFVHPQLMALLDTAKAGIDVLRGDLGAAENHVRDAAEAAIRSHDQPIMSFVALQFGVLALARGDVPLAVRAVDVATVLIGAYDSTHPQVQAIDEAALNAGIGRPGTNLPDRPIAIETLKTLVQL